MSTLRRLGIRLLLVLVTLALLVLAAPHIVARTPLLGIVVRSALRGIDGRATVGQATLGWFSSPVLEDVELLDRDDVVVARVPRVVGDRPLWRLLWDRRNAGGWSVEQPTLSVVFDGEESNLERLFSGKRKPSTATSAGNLTGSLTITDATVQVADADSETEWTFESIEGTATLSANAPLQLAVRGEYRDTKAPGQFHANLQFAGPTTLGGHIETKSLPIESFAPLLRRFAHDARLVGRLTARLDGELTAETASVDGSVRIERLALSHPSLGQDTLSLAECDGVLKAKWADGRLSISQAEARCDVGSASVVGEFDPASEPLALLDRPGYQVRADVDVARLLTLLPHLVPLRNEVRLTGGQIRANVTSEAGSGGVVWQGSVRTADLRGKHRGQPIAWNSPIALEFRLRKPTDGFPKIEQWRCQAEFLEVDLSGAAEEWKARATCDLSRLATQLEQFIELGAARPAGALTAQATVRMTGPRAGRLQVHAQFRDWRLPTIAGRVWEEENLELTAEAAGGFDSTAPRLDAATVTANLGGPTATARLVAPVANLRTDPLGKIAIEGKGGMAPWRRRLALWTTALDDLQFTGAAEWSIVVAPTASGVEFENGRLETQNARLVVFGLDVREPRLIVRASGSWDAATGATVLRKARIRGESLAANADEVTISPAGNGDWNLIGRVNVTGEAERIQRWFGPPAPGVREEIGGKIQGVVDLKPAVQAIGIHTDLTIEDLTYGVPGAPSHWREPRVRVVAVTRYEPAADLLRLDQLHVSTDALAAASSGTLEQASARQRLTLNGELHYELSRLEPQLRPYLGKGVRFLGGGNRPFSARIALGVANPLRTLRGEASARLAGAQVFGGSVGPFEVKANAADGWLRFEPIDTTLNGGRAHVNASLRLDPAPLELHLARAGIDHFQLTPATCASALAYALPILADVLEAEGDLSVTVENGRIPLHDLNAADVSGRITIHHGRIGPSPLVRELSVLLRVPSGASFARESVVPFRLQNGRVHHRDLALTFPDFTLKTQGSVGLDGSLDLVAELPVPPKWLGNNPVGKALANRTVRLPIRGTMGRPKLDERALAAALADVAREAAVDRVRDELGKRLQDALRPR